MSSESAAGARADGVELDAPVSPEFAEILTPAALAFVEKLVREFGPALEGLMAARVERQKEIDAGAMPEFLTATEAVRDAGWSAAPIPEDLLDRRVEITGPVDRKMIINALNCGANVFMADFEDSNSPTWRNTVQGQINLRDACAGTITFTNPQGKRYALGERTATLMVRPRGWHLVDKHVRVDGRPVPAALLISSKVVLVFFDAEDAAAVFVENAL